jgi:signal transduction histidine kinase
MSGPRRARLPWVLWAVGMLLLGGTLTFTVLNRRTAFDEDPYFVPIAIVMILGYSTVGAVLASRNPRSPIAWLMMTVGLAFVLTGFTSEYLAYAYVTKDGSPVIGPIVGLLSNALYLPMFAAIILLVLLFPTGRVPGPRWRYLPAGIGVLLALAEVAGALMPGDLDLDVGRIANPLGVDGLRPVTEAVATVGWLGLLAAGAPLSVAALVLRYRRSRGEERQQIRWLAYVGATLAVEIVLGLAVSSIAGESHAQSVAADAFFIAGFVLLGIGVPVAMGAAVLKYHLYDLDLVVKKTVLYAIVAALLTTVFIAVFLGIGWIAGGTDVGAIVAAAAIGLAVWPGLRLARWLADRIVYGTRATPYEVLAEFSGRVGGAYGDEDVLPRMAQILRDAVGAARATVWLRVGGELRAAAVVPEGDVPAALPVVGNELPPIDGESVEVRHRGELLGALAVSMPPNDRLSPSRERLVRDLAAQAGLVLRNVRLIEELRASRHRLVAAQDQERRRIERNIHDGAQQQLVALAVKLRLADSLVGKDDERAHAMLTDLQAETNGALENLRDLARGIYPPLLADKGLGAALEGQIRKSTMPVTLDVDGIGRYPQEIEAAVYFCTLEALQNVAKYANASAVDVRLIERDGSLEFAIGDDGRGFDPTAASGSGLTNMRDRLDSLGGSLGITSALGHGTTVAGTIPVGGNA